MANVFGTIFDNGGAIYNVRHTDFGAVGNGTDDDKAAIQAAINACSAAGGGVVYFPPGRYMVKTSLALQQGIWLVGDSSRFSTSAPFGTEIVTDQAILLLNGVLGSFSEFNGGIAHLYLSAENVGAALGIQLANTASFCMFDCVLNGFQGGPALRLDDVQWSLFEHCHFKNCSTGVKLTHPASGPSNGNVFHSCRFENCNFRGLEAHSSTGTGIQLLKLDSCYFVGCGSASDSQRGAISVQRVRDLTVSHGWFELNEGGASIWLRDLTIDPKIVGNFFAETTGKLAFAAVYAESGAHLPIITDNHFEGTELKCIKVNSGAVQAFIARNWTGLTGASIIDDSHVSPAGDTTPSVMGSDYLVLSNPSAVTVTTLDDGVPGQRVTLVFTNGNTTLREVGTGGSFQLAGSSNFVGTSNDTITVIRHGTLWYEVSRSVN